MVQQIFLIIEVFHLVVVNNLVIVNQHILVLIVWLDNQETDIGIM
jgi:hypothetical protein